MLLAAALGALVGLVLALTGAGGAIIAVPLLVFGFDLDLVQAAPIALLAVAASAALGALLGLRAGIVRYRAAILMSVVGSLLTPLGVLLAHRLPEHWLSLVFALVLIFVAQRMFLQARGELRGVPPITARPGTAACKLNQDSGRFQWTAPCARALAQAGVVTGLLSGLLGVGGGFVIVPALRRSSDLPMNSIVATSLLVVAIVSSSAVLSAVAAGRLETAVAAPFAAGATLAMLAGRLVAGRIAGPRLQQGFSVAAGLVAILMIGSLVV
ncbi:MAG: sulfite exporter TauE/SafE family protein [Gammaproteobacteria bacterium]|nr:sulfite exporter TauE/SafE family protein [Gammaproteobacteria bacterium]